MKYLLECLDKTPGSAEQVIMNEYHNEAVAADAPNTDDEKGSDDEAQANPPPVNEGVVPPPQAAEEKAQRVVVPV